MAHHQPITYKNRVSIIIPAFNHDKYLSRAVDSALNQTYGDVEVIVVNDGSTDATAAVAKGYGERVRYIEQTNQGQAIARNRGIRLSSGEFVLLLDSDDWLEPHAAECEVRKLHEIGEQYALVGCKNNAWRPDGTLMNPEDEIEGDATTIDVTWADILLANREKRFSTTAVCMRRAALEECGLFDESFGRLGSEDRDLWLRLAAKYRLCILRDRLVNSGIHGENASGDPTRQLPGMVLFLRKARQGNLRQRWRLALWARAYAGFYFQASTIYRSAGDPGSALCNSALSLLVWPWFGVSRQLGQPSGTRLRRVFVCLGAFLSMPK